MPSTLQTARLQPQHAAGLVQLFADAGCACHCQFWHFAGRNNDWLLRCATAPGDNAAALRDRVAASGDALQGVVALSDEQIVGWMKLQPAPELEKLYAQRLYRGLACFTDVPRDRVYTIGCFLVHPEYRRTGVAASLLAKGLECARACGAEYIEAFPRTDDHCSEATLWTGPPKLYERAGFHRVHDFDPYPVLRRPLGPA